MMRKLGGVAVLVVSVIGVVGLAWSAFSLTSHAMFLSRHGVQNWARVLKFGSVSRTPKGGYTFYYFVEVDGIPREHGFRQRLREESVIPLLASPTDPNDFEIGHVGDSSFVVFTHEIGSPALAYLIVAFYPIFFLIILPVAVVELWRQHRAGGGLLRPAPRTSSNQSLEPTSVKQDTEQAAGRRDGHI